MKRPMLLLGLFVLIGLAGMALIVEYPCGLYQDVPWSFRLGDGLVVMAVLGMAGSALLGAKDALTSRWDAAPHGELARLVRAVVWLLLLAVPLALYLWALMIWMWACG